MKENDKINKYLDFATELKKAMEHEDDVDDDDTNCSWCVWNSSQRLGKRNGKKNENQS